MQPTADDNRQPTQVIWEREIDRPALASRWRKLGLFYGTPMVVALLVAFALGGLGAFLGILILLGLFGVLLVALVFFKNLNARSNARAELDGGHLVIGRRRIELSRVEVWSTHAAGEDWAVTDAALFGNPMAGNAITARVAFRLAVYDEAGRRAVGFDGGPAFEVVSAVWAEMPPEQLHRLGAALAAHIPAPLVAPGELRP